MPTPSSLPPAPKVGPLEPFHEFNGPMPTGVTVSSDQRIFVNFPEWGDQVPSAVVEIKNGKEEPYPPKLEFNNQPLELISVQSVVVDEDNKLWIVDTGRPKWKPAEPRGPKLVRVDLETSDVVQVIDFDTDVVTPETYLNDVRFHLELGEKGMAFITDSSDNSGNGLIVVDLHTKASWRCLGNHRSVKAETNFLPKVENQDLFRWPGQKPMAVGSDGIAIEAGGERLFYRPLSGRGLYSVPLGKLLHQSVSDQDVEDHGNLGFASDGLEADQEGRLYLTDYENNAIRWWAKGELEILVQDPRALWPDTLALTDGYLYFTANQLHRQAEFNTDLKDRRERPYFLFRVRIDDAKPVRLKR